MLPRKTHPAALSRAMVLAGAGATALLVWSLWPVAMTPAQPKNGKALPKTEEVFGYTQAFEQELKKLGQIAPEELAQRYPTRADYLKGLSWDPTTAKFWKEFQADPKTTKNPLRADFR